MQLGFSFDIIIIITIPANFFKQLSLATGIPLKFYFLYVYSKSPF